MTISVGRRRRADHVHWSNVIDDVEFSKPKIRATDEHASDLIMAKEKSGRAHALPR
jgi:hypothetical protein